MVGVEKLGVSEFEESARVQSFTIVVRRPWSQLHGERGSSFARRGAANGTKLTRHPSRSVGRPRGRNGSNGRVRLPCRTEVGYASRGCRSWAAPPTHQHAGRNTELHTSVVKRRKSVTVKTNIQWRGLDELHREAHLAIMRYGDDQERAGRAARAPASARAPARRVSAGPRSRSQSRPRSAASMCEEQQWQQVGTHNGTAWHGHGVMTPHSYDASFNVQHSPPLRSFSPYAPPSHARTQSDWHGGLQQLQLQPMVSPNSRPIPPPPSFPPHQLGMPSPEQAWQAAVADGFNDL